ncbi:MAG: hypothetical protein J0H68_00445 [Sphingobacteriia bacterium]|nr:hypothetical protein [Sphingobacteriia bacterium]
MQSNFREIRDPATFFEEIIRDVISSHSNTEKNNSLYEALSSNFNNFKFIIDDNRNLNNKLLISKLKLSSDINLTIGILSILNTRKVSYPFSQGTIIKILENEEIGLKNETSTTRNLLLHLIADSDPKFFYETIKEYKINLETIAPSNLKLLMALGASKISSLKNISFTLQNNIPCSEYDKYLSDKVIFNVFFMLLIMEKANLADNAINKVQTVLKEQTIKKMSNIEKANLAYGYHLMSEIVSANIDQKARNEIKETFENFIKKMHPEIDIKADKQMDSWLVMERMLKHMQNGLHNEALANLNQIIALRSRAFNQFENNNLISQLPSNTSLENACELYSQEETKYLKGEVLPTMCKTLYAYVLNKKIEDKKENNTHRSERDAKIALEEILGGLLNLS